jgi:hypothetical protein
LVLPPNDGEPQRDLAPTSICFHSELLCCLIQDIAQARRLALLIGECGLRRSELRMQRGYRCRVPRIEGLERSL